MVALDACNEIILDSSNLVIESVICNSMFFKSGSPLKFKVDNHDERFGSKLVIALKQPLETDHQITLKINYCTSASSSAIQWLTPLQTVGNKFPYMFTQCQVYIKFILGHSCAICTAMPRHTGS
jgi:leukotriene-A4 hydrolase